MWKTAFKKFEKIWSAFKFFKDCLPQISLGPFLNTLTRFLQRKHLMQYFIFISLAPWYSCNHYCTTLFNKAWSQVLCRFKSYWQRLGDLRWWESLTMFNAFVSQPFNKNNSLYSRKCNKNLKLTIFSYFRPFYFQSYFKVPRALKLIWEIWKSLNFQMFYSMFFYIDKNWRQ